MPEWKDGKKVFFDRIEISIRFFLQLMARNVRIVFGIWTLWALSLSSFLSEAPAAAARDRRFI